MTAKKLSISLTGEAAAAAAETATRLGISISEVIRRALALQRFVDRQVAQGDSLLVRRVDGSTDRVEFVFS